LHNLDSARKQLGPGSKTS